MLIGFWQVVTCGSIPLETSFQKVQRCVYASSELYEYRGCGVKPANAKQRWFSWGCTYSEVSTNCFTNSKKSQGSSLLMSHFVFNPLHMFKFLLCLMSYLLYSFVMWRFWPFIVIQLLHNACNRDLSVSLWLTLLCLYWLYSFPI